MVELTSDGVLTFLADNSRSMSISALIGVVGTWILYVLILYTILLFRILSGENALWMRNVLRAWKPEARLFFCCRCWCLCTSGLDPCSTCIPLHNKPKQVPGFESEQKDDIPLIEASLQSQEMGMSSASRGHARSSSSNVSSSHSACLPQRAKSGGQPLGPAQAELQANALSYGSAPIRSSRQKEGCMTSSAGWFSWSLPWDQRIQRSVKLDREQPELLQGASSGSGTLSGRPSSARRNMVWEPLRSPIHTPRQVAGEQPGKLWWSHNAYGLPFSGVTAEGLVADTTSKSASCIPPCEATAHESPRSAAPGMKPAEMSHGDRPAGFICVQPNMRPAQVSPSVSKARATRQPSAAQSTPAAHRFGGTQSSAFTSKRRSARMPARLFEEVVLPHPVEIAKRRVEIMLAGRRHPHGHHLHDHGGASGAGHEDVDHATR